MKKAWSLTSRLTLWYATSAFFLTVISTLALYWSMARTLNRSDALLISDRVQTLINLLNSETANLNSIKIRVEREWATRKFEQIYVNVLDSRGQTIAETPGFDDIAPSLFEDARGTITARETPTGRVFKVEIVKSLVGSPSQHEYTIRIALDRTQEEALLAAYRSRLLGILLATFLLAALIGRRMALRGLQPIADIARTAKTIRSTTLHERLNLENLPAELTTLANTFNEMLDRLNESFDRLSRFSSDIAHDLRTPLNNLRGELEVALGRSRTPEQYHEVLGSCLEECARISRLIDNLLFLARAENPSAQLALEQFNLRQEILRLTDFFEASAVEGGLTLKVEIPAELSIRVDRALFQRALGNILSNSLNYTRPGGLIKISASASGATIMITLQDTGVGIPEVDLPRICDRFYRVDQARSSKSGGTGTGLGLSIVKSIMTLHKGRIEIASELGKGTSVELSFPQP